MENKPLVGDALDLIMLEEFERPFFVEGEGYRDIRCMRRTGKCEKQLYAIWNKKRYCRWIEFGVSLRAGWLTDAGKKRLAELRKNKPLDTPDKSDKVQPNKPA